ncbi:MAG: hypothetical protein HQL94_08140 [Magnetococcales bacterium]|nr:hypothetical protein [Magnetococcales bacterium]MBF0439736.1 hypothetical protein [Magnetococcales bacterium]
MTFHPYHRVLIAFIGILAIVVSSRLQLETVSSLLAGIGLYGLLAWISLKSLIVPHYLRF